MQLENIYISLESLVKSLSDSISYIICMTKRMWFMFQLYHLLLTMYHGNWQYDKTCNCDTATTLNCKVVHMLNKYQTFLSRFTAFDTVLIIIINEYHLVIVLKQ